MANNSDEKKAKFSIRKLIYNDKYLIIISIITSLVIWVATSMNLSPETTKTISVSVPVDFSDSAAEQLGIKCFGDETVNVDVTVSCKKYLAKDITADNLNVSLQTNAVTTSGYSEVPIKVETADKADFKITSYYPTVYRAYFDVEDEKTMDIELKYSNRDFIEDGYIMGEPLLSESTVTIKGPRSYVSQVETVSASIDINEKLKATTSMDLNAVALDSYGSKVNYITIETSGENLTITLPVLKEMLLDVEAGFTGKPSRISMSDFDISYSVNKVNAGVLDDAKIEKANIGNIDFSSLHIGENKFKFDVNAIDGLVVLDNVSEIEVSITVPDSFSSKSIDINSGNVTVINVPEGYDAVVTGVDTDSVYVIGASSNLTNLGSTNVNLIVDLSGVKSDEIKTGSSVFTANTALDNSDTCWIYGSYKVTLNIVEK